MATRGWIVPIHTHLPLALSADRARAVCLRVGLHIEVSAAALVVVGEEGCVRLRLGNWRAREIEHCVGHWLAMVRRVRAIGSEMHALFNRAEREGRSEERQHLSRSPPAS